MQALFSKKPVVITNWGKNPLRGTCTMCKVLTAIDRQETCWACDENISPRVTSPASPAQTAIANVQYHLAAVARRGFAKVGSLWVVIGRESPTGYWRVNKDISEFFPRCSRQQAVVFSVNGSPWLANIGETTLVVQCLHTGELRAPEQTILPGAVAELRSDMVMILRIGDVQVPDGARCIITF